MWWACGRQSECVYYKEEIKGQQEKRKKDESKSQTWQYNWNLRDHQAAIAPAVTVLRLFFNTNPFFIHNLSLRLGFLAGQLFPNSFNILHIWIWFIRDLKIENFLLDEHNNIKIVGECLAMRPF